MSDELDDELRDQAWRRHAPGITDAEIDALDGLYDEQGKVKAPYGPAHVLAAYRLGRAAQAPESRPVYPQVWCGDSSGPNGIGGTCVLGPGHLHRDGLGGEWPVEPSGDTVQAPDVAALPPDVVAVIEAAQAWVANNARAGHTPTGPAARLADAVCALLGTARALLGTDTTPESHT